MQLCSRCKTLLLVSRGNSLKLLTSKTYKAFPSRRPFQFACAFGEWAAESDTFRLWRRSYSSKLIAEAERRALHRAQSFGYASGKKEPDAPALPRLRLAPQARPPRHQLPALRLSRQAYGPTP